MGKLNIFEISFANMSGAFYAGTILQGHVTLELNEPMKMRGITLKFEGHARVHWTETHTTGTGNNSKTETRHYTATEGYFNQSTILYGLFSNQGNSTTELGQGRYVYPFQFQLPPELPSSFESMYGSVRYTVKCNIDKPWKFDHSTKRAFTVISILDLNQLPNCLDSSCSYCKEFTLSSNIVPTGIHGTQGSNQKFLCCLCCKTGPIQASMRMDRTGYVPGEAIKISAEINNNSNRKMDKSYIDLKMITTFHSTTKSRITCQEVARITRPQIEAHGFDAWNGEQLVIPPLPPSFLTGCRIIDIRYVLQLNVDPSGLGFDLEVPLDVVIGTIPLISVVQQYPPMPPLGFNSWQPSGVPPPDAVYPTAPPLGIPDMPPPSYSECITGRVSIREEGDNEHTRGNLEYAPVYTYYNWGKTPGALPAQGKAN